ncbi:hypothetical protein ACFYTG_20485 [Streptomyces mirabilis]|uniref:hypothetical protein n=1 Tax=Streptomyces mirabilis TaxID=68239 RepID=UPI003683B12B
MARPGPSLFRDQPVGGQRYDPGHSPREPSGDQVSSYSDVQKAVRVEKLRIWLAWLAGNVIMLMIANAAKNVAVVSVVTQILLVVVFVLHSPSPCSG